MLLFDFSSVFCLVVYAHIAESKVYILRDYDNNLIYIDSEDKRVQIETQISKQKPLLNSGNKPKRLRRPKQAVLQYGRHIYHLDNFEDLTKLRSRFNLDSISYDYFDFKDLFKSRDSYRTKPSDYRNDILILAPSHKRCKDEKCEGNLRKYNPFKPKSEPSHPKLKVGIVKHGKKHAIRHNPYKRFKIVDNSKLTKSKAARKPMKKKIYDSEEVRYHKRKPIYGNKKKYIAKPVEESRESKWYNSKESEKKYVKNKNKKKKIYPSHSAESLEKALKKFQKKFPHDDSSDSIENKLKYYDSNSIEDSWQKKKKKKKHNYNSSDEKKRKTFDSNTEMILQGNNMYDIKGFSDDYENDRRRRLPQFLPKRYHWNPENINELGYYWFNGPKGKYPSPTLVGRRKNSIEYNNLVI